MNLDLKHKQAIVCGSTQGIGKAIALELANLGANVTLIARNEEALKIEKQELSTTAGQLHSYLCVDFSKPEELKNILDAYLQSQPIVHILVNNTGGPPAGPAHLAKTDEFLSAFNSKPTGSPFVFESLRKAWTSSHVSSSIYTNLSS